MIRVANLEDLPIITEYGMKFAAASSYATYAEEDKIKELITTFLVAPNNKKVILLAEGGMLAASADPMIIGSVMVATEFVWWVEPEMRKNGLGQALVDAYEYWAKKVGCKIVTMSALDDLVEKFYARNGYVPYERTHFKELT